MPKVASKLGAPDRATDVLEPPVASRFADMSASEQVRLDSCAYFPLPLLPSSICL